MGIIKHGINGAFSGTVGAVVGSSWRGLDYMKGRPKRSKNQPSSEQVLTREKFKELSEFLVFFNKALEVGLKNQNLNRMTAYNLAVRLNKDAWVKSGEGVALDYSRIVLSKGRAVGKPAACKAEWTGPARLRIQWEVFGYSPVERPADKVVLAAYCEARVESVSDIGSRLRSEKEASMEFPVHWASCAVQVYMFMVSAKGLCSETVFVGSFKQYANG